MKKTLGILSALAMSGTAFADVNVSGYVDAGYGWSNKAAGDANAFSFNEGGVWFTGNSGGSGFVLDVGVGNGYSLDVDSDGENEGFGSVEVQQAYITHKYDNGFSWGLGMWDSQLGSESNDSVNRHFLKTGLLDDLLPATETGALFGYDLSDTLALHLWVVNGSDTKDINYPALGFKLSSKMDGMNARVGAQFVNGVVEDASGKFSSNSETGYMIDVGADTKMGDIHVAAQLVLVKAAVKDGESGLGFGVEGGTAIGEGATFDLGVEWENGKSDGTDTKTTTLELRAGPRFALSEALTVKADYTMKKAKDVDATHAIDLAGIYKF